MAIAMKALLQERHWHGYSDFLAEYRRHATCLDGSPISAAPTKSQYYRWLSGQLHGLPRGYHCRVLEAMFPGWTAERLFDSDSGTALAPPSVSGYAEEAVSAYPTRAAFARAIPPEVLFDGVRNVRMSGVSLNMLCQQYSDTALRRLLLDGVRFDCLFLAPQSSAMRAREIEEGHDEGRLSTLTELNIAVLQRLRAELGPNMLGELNIRTYNETVRFNLTILDAARLVMQPYLPSARGVEAPTFVVDAPSQVLDTFAAVFGTQWQRGTTVP